MNVIITQSKKFIIITFQLEEGLVLSWEQIQNFKDEHFEDLDFFEIYPKKNEIINKANERHIVHQIGSIVPKMHDFEEELLQHKEMKVEIEDECLLKLIQKVRRNNFQLTFTTLNKRFYIDVFDSRMEHFFEENQKVKIETSSKSISECVKNINAEYDILEKD